jgi:hypothetical protein
MDGRPPSNEDWTDQPEIRNMRRAGAALSTTIDGQGPLIIADIEREPL